VVNLLTGDRADMLSIFATHEHIRALLGGCRQGGCHYPQTRCGRERQADEKLHSPDTD